MPEALVFELVFDFLEAEAVGERGEDVEGSLTDPPFLVRGEGRQGFQIVEAVAQFDDDDSEVFRGRYKEPPQILDLFLVSQTEFDTADLGDTFDQETHFLAEEFLDFLRSHGSVFDNVMEQGCGQCGSVGNKFDEGFRDRHRVGDIVLSRKPALVAMRFDGEIERPPGKTPQDWIRFWGELRENTFQTSVQFDPLLLG